MQSLFDLHRRGEPMGGLLGGYTPSNEIVDRATMLPIGQYEDGSLTFAWPGFLKDAYEGAVRSYEQGRQLPRADDSGYYAGTPRAEPLDAFNAASIGPVSGVASRAAGAIPRGALGSGGSDVIRRLGTENAKGAGRLLDGHSPTGTPAVRSEGYLPVHSQSGFVGPQGPGTHMTTMSDPLITRIASEYDLDPIGALTPSIAKIIADPGPYYYGIRTTPYEVKPGAIMPDSTQWYQDAYPQPYTELSRAERQLVKDAWGDMYDAEDLKGMSFDANYLDHGRPLGGASAIGIISPQADISAKMIDRGRGFQSYGSKGDFVHLVRSRTAGQGLDAGEYIMPNAEVVASAPYANTLFANPENAGLPYLMTNALERAAAELPMDQASRLQRGRALGFDTDTPLFHGTEAAFDRFDPDLFGARYGGDRFPSGFDLTPNRKLAEWHADGERVMSLYGKLDEERFFDTTASKMVFQPDHVQDAVRALGIEFGPMTPTADVLAQIGSGPEARQKMMDQGLLGLIHKMDKGLAGDATTYRLFDPRDIRSTDAAFDPAQSGSANLFAANPTESSLPYLMTNGMEEDGGQATTHPFVPPRLGFQPPNPQDNEMRREMRHDGLIPDPERNYRLFRMRPPAPFDMDPWNRLLEQEYDRMFQNVPREQIPEELRRPLDIFDWPDDGMPITSR